MTIPTWHAAGPKAEGTGAVTPTTPDTAVDDVLVLLCQSANQVVTLTDAQGFALFAQIGVGSAGAAGSTRLTLFWCRATLAGVAGTMPAPTVGDPGDHVLARIFGLRGCVATGVPFSLVTQDALPAPSTVVTIPGGDSLAPESLIGLFSAHAIDANASQHSGEANPDLGSVIERFESGTSQGVGGGFMFTTGTKATPGAFGPTTATLAAPSAQVRMSIEIRSQDVPPPPDPVVTVFPEGVRFNIAIPDGIEGFDETSEPIGLRLTFRLGIPFIVLTNDPGGPGPVDADFRVGSVIETARDRHASFDKNRHPDPLLVRYLDRIQRELVAKALQRNMSFMAVTYPLPLPLADFTAGVLLPFTYHLLLGGDVVLASGDRGSFSLVPWGQRYDPGVLYAGWVHGERLYLRWERADWQDVTRIELSYVPTVSRLTSIKSGLQLPRSAEPVLVEACSAFMALRGHNDPALSAIDVGGYVATARAAEDAWLAEIGARRRTQMKRIREVW